MSIQVCLGAAYENPLIPNARLRQIYLAMAKARLLDKALPVARRRRTRGLEGCLVSSAIDLACGDLVSDALAGAVIDFLRGAPLASLLGRASPNRKSSKKHVGEANCSGAAALPGSAHIAERLWSALGAAAALKSHAVRQSPSPSAQPLPPTPFGVVMIYALPGEVPAALWQSILAFAAKNELPAVFVVLPAPQASKTRPAKLGSVSPIALRCGVPGIPVDADDPVAIYRVAQESIGRARAGGGPALLECALFVIEGIRPGRARSVDAISALERYILERGVASQTWIDRESKSFALRLAAQRSAM